MAQADPGPQSYSLGGKRGSSSIHNLHTYTHMHARIHIHAYAHSGGSHMAEDLLSNPFTNWH